MERTNMTGSHCAKLFSVSVKKGSAGHPRPSDVLQACLVQPNHLFAMLPVELPVDRPWKDPEHSLEIPEQRRNGQDPGEFCRSCVKTGIQKHEEQETAGN